MNPYKLSLLLSSRSVYTRNDGFLAMKMGESEFVGNEGWSGDQGWGRVGDWVVQLKLGCLCTMDVFPKVTLW